MVSLTHAVAGALSTALGVFVVLFIFDELLGIGDALLTGAFQKDKLLSFLESQFATQAAKVVVVAVITAYFANGTGQPGLVGYLMAAASVAAAGQTLLLSHDVLLKVQKLAYDLVAKLSPK